MRKELRETRAALAWTMPARIRLSLVVATLHSIAQTCIGYSDGMN